MKLLTLTEASDRLGLSTSRLRQFIGEGRLKATLMGKTYVVTEREVARFMALERKQGRPSA
jgi:excisionase family DNA binding protein